LHKNGRESDFLVDYRHGNIARLMAKVMGMLHDSQYL
jgi:hypothetical protein